MRALLRHMACGALAAAATCTASPAFADATVILVNANAPGVGMNEPSPRAPVGGNTGTTLGQQRLNALRYAADIWASQLDSPVPIRIVVAFTTRTCTATGAVLASAGPYTVSADFPAQGAFPGPVQASTWHHAALANKRAGFDLVPEADDLQALFNINLGAANCLAGSGFYYGLDANEPADGVDLVAVALHEFGHGLGFSQFASLSTGALFLGLPDVYGQHLLDTSFNRTWDQLTDAERVASAINARRVVWNGAEVSAAAPATLALGVPELTVSAPAAIAGTYEVGTASFGAPLSAAGVSGQIVQALDAADAAGPTTFDACSPLTNAAAVAGRIALVDRGTCGFVVKAANVQAAGAIAMVVADNAPGAPPAGLGGADPAILIPAVRVTITDGALIKAQLGAGVLAQLGLDMTRRAGTNDAGLVFVNAPNPVVPGSSISHWDPVASPNQVMEPNINRDLVHALTAPTDLTLPLMRDIGWFPDADNEGIADAVDQCDASDLRASLFVGTTDTGIANRLFTTGCTMSDYLGLAAAAAGNHGAYVSAVAQLANAWLAAGLITDQQKDLLMSLVARRR